MNKNFFITKAYLFENNCKSETTRKISIKILFFILFLIFLIQNFYSILKYHIWVKTSDMANLRGSCSILKTQTQFTTNFATCLLFL